MGRKHKPLLPVPDDQTTLYPAVETVFKDTALGLYFRPLMTVNVTVSGKPYAIHLLGTDGLMCDENKTFPYSENYFFGFTYDNGRYEFLGNLEVFTDHDRIPSLHAMLVADFRQNRDQYLAAKTMVIEYIDSMRDELEAFSDMEDAAYYAKAFYSYEFTKYYYEKYGSHQHVSVVTQGYAKNTNPFLLEREDAQDILEEYFINLEDNNYEIREEMFVAGTERHRFMSKSGGGDVLAFVDPAKDIVYLLELPS